MMSMLCNCCIRELLILARTWFAFGLPSKTGCDIYIGPNSKIAVGEKLLFSASHRTVWWCTGQSGGAPDSAL
jgi:hypothetical protein